MLNAAKMANSNEAGHDMAILAECPICMETYKEPKQFHCGHTVCLVCVENIWASSKGQLNCPLCRRQVKIPSEGLRGLPTNRFVINFLDLLKTPKKPIEETDNKCSSCAIRGHEAVAEKYCKDCKKYLCALCSKKHQSLPVFARHQVILTSNFDIICQTHGDVFNYICLDCNRLLCSYCIEDESCEGHDIRDINDVIENRTSQLHGVLVKLTTEISRIEGIYRPQVTELDKRLKTLVDVGNTVKSQMVAIINEVSHNGDRNLAALKKEHNMVKKMRDEACAQGENTSQQVALLYTLREVANAALHKGKEHIVTALPNINAQIPDTSQIETHKVKYTPREVHFEPHHSLTVGTLVWSEADAKLIAAEASNECEPLLGIGSVSLTDKKTQKISKIGTAKPRRSASTRTRYSEVRKPRKTSSPSLGIQFGLGHQDSDANQNPTQSDDELLDLSSSAQLDPYGTPPYRPLINLDTEPGTTASKNIKKGMPPLFWEKRDFVQAYDITFLPTGNIAVSDYEGDKVMLYRHDGELLANSSLAVPRIDMNNPGGIIYHRQENALMVLVRSVMGSLGHVVVLNPNDLHYIRHFQLASSSAKLPSRFAILKDGTLVVSHFLGVVNLYNTRGDLLRNLLPVGVLGPESYIQVNTWDQILVTDFQYHCVKVYNKEGRMTKKFGTESSMYKPCCLAIDDLGMYSDLKHVVVANTRKDIPASKVHISLWNTGGQYVSKIMDIESTPQDQLQSVAKQGSLLAILTSKELYLYNLVVLQQQKI